MPHARNAARLVNQLSREVPQPTRRPLAIAGANQQACVRSNRSTKHLVQEPGPVEIHELVLSLLALAALRAVVDSTEAKCVE